jgi:hypothetical protein
MPRVECGSIGVHARNGRLYLNNKILEGGSKGSFEPGQQLGIGMTFSMKDGTPQPAHDTPATKADSFIQVEVFVSRDRRKVATWDLGDQSRATLGDGFEGNHDIYAAVGTRGEVNVDVIFEDERRYWWYNPGFE